jgi:hypothetical protein
MLSIYPVNENDIITIIELLKRKPPESKYYYDSEDYLGFMYLKIDNTILEWQDRGNNKMCFLGVQNRNDRYDLAYPEGELLKKLIEATDKEKKRMQFGETLRVKLNIKISEKPTSVEEIEEKTPTGKSHMKTNQIFGFFLFGCGLLTMLVPFFTNFHPLIISTLIFVSGFTTGFIGVKNVFDVKID